MTAKPAFTPVTIPDELTVAADGLLLDHEPPATVLVKGDEYPMFNKDEPEREPAVTEATIFSVALSEWLPQ
jgi:hypothetical protein